MDKEYLRIIGPILRGASLLSDDAGRPLGVPAFVSLASGEQGKGGADGEGAIRAKLDRPDVNEAARAIIEALSTWRSKPGRERALPALFNIDTPKGSLGFVLGRDKDDVDAKKRAAQFHLWSPDIAQANQALSSASRADVVRGRVAVVTGGAQGIGGEIVRGLCFSGAFVYVADLNEQGAKATCDSLNAECGRTVAIPLSINVADEASVSAAFGEIARTSGGLDLVVSNAGVLKAGSVLEQSFADFRYVTEINYLAFFLVAKYSGQLFRAQSATAASWFTDIIQINSKSGLQGSNRNGAYAGSKFGGIGLVQSFALELVEQRTKVNAICPGNFYDGPLWSDPEKGLFVQYLRTGKVPGARTVADIRAFYEAKAPIRRGCAGPDVMRAIYYLVEQEYETGQALPVAGGQVMLS